VPEDGFASLLREATGVSLGTTLSTWVNGTGDLPLARLLAPFGVNLTLAATDATPTLGMRVAQRGADLTVATAYSGGAAHRAGLSAGDVVVACDGLRVSHEAALKALLSRRQAGQRVRLIAFRRDELLEVDAMLDAPAQAEARLTFDANTHALRDGWLGTRRRAAARADDGVRQTTAAGPARGRRRA
jgi:predicted metalloprotease with PDZ domain